MNVWLRSVATLVCLAATTMSCTQHVQMKRQDPVESLPVENVAVLLFYQDTETGPAYLADLATDAFSMQAHRYFPALVDRYKVRDFLKQHGYEHANALTPHILKEMGDFFEVDGVFTGTITGYSEEESFLGWKGKAHFKMGCRLLSTKNGRDLIAAQVDVSGSYLLPVENPKDRVILGVKMLTNSMRLDERFGPLYITRLDPLWIKAMEHYESREFWDATETFSEIVTTFGKSDLRDEAEFYLGRSIEELSLPGTAKRVYSRLGVGAFASRSAYQLTQIRFQEGDDDGVAQALQSFVSRFPNDPLLGGMRYTTGLSQMRRGDPAAAIRNLALVPEESNWYKFARYAMADPYRALGDTTSARLALERAAEPFGGSESDRRLEGRAKLALGDLHFSLGNHAEAVRWYQKSDLEFLPRARLGMAWVAAEGGDFVGAIHSIAKIDGPLELRYLSEAHFLAGTCLARLQRFDDSADSFDEALGACRSWKDEEAKQQDLRVAWATAKQQYEESMRPREADIASLLFLEPSPDTDDRLTIIRKEHEQLAERLSDLAEKLDTESDPAEDAVVRKQIQERAEFSLAQIRYEKQITGAHGGGGSR